MSTPLVMERSRVQSSLAAPAFPNHFNELVRAARCAARRISANIGGTWRAYSRKTRGGQS